MRNWDLNRISAPFLFHKQLKECGVLATESTSSPHQAHLEHERSRLFEIWEHKKRAEIKI